MFDHHDDVKDYSDGIDDSIEQRDGGKNINRKVGSEGKAETAIATAFAGTTSVTSTGSTATTTLCSPSVGTKPAYSIAAVSTSSVTSPTSSVTSPTSSVTSPTSSVTSPTSWVVSPTTSVTTQTGLLSSSMTTPTSSTTMSIASVNKPVVVVASSVMTPSSTASDTTFTPNGSQTTQNDLGTLPLNVSAAQLGKLQLHSVSDSKKNCVIL